VVTQLGHALEVVSCNQQMSSSPVLVNVSSGWVLGVIPADPQKLTDSIKCQDVG